MIRTFTAALLAASAFCSVPATAQDMLAEDSARMRAKLEALHAQVAAMEARLIASEERAADDREETGEPVTSIAWKGAPEFTSESGWSFKPRGRLQYDVGWVEAPKGNTDPGLGFGNEVRRARLGVEGDIPGGFGYKFELDFADGVEITDAILTYEDGDFGATVGQHNNFQSLEELTSSRFISFMERAAFTDAFGFERRVGASGEFPSGALLVQAGVFTDNIADLESDENNSAGADGRVVFSPKLGETQLHFGGSLHYRDLGDAASSVRYRQRPFVHTTDTRFIDTGSIGTDSETGYGVEAALVSGRFHAAAEGFWQKVSRSGLADPIFFGGYAEAGYFLTQGDSRGYKGGTFDRVKPANGFEKGGIGAVQVNVRYDYLDLVDQGIIGGQQNAYALSLIWTPTAYTRLMANYARLEYDMAALTAAGDADYGVDVFGMRAQIDF